MSYGQEAITFQAGYSSGKGLYLGRLAQKNSGKFRGALILRSGRNA